MALDSQERYRNSILGKPSYSGVDVRVVARLYDGGKLIKDEIAKWNEEKLNIENNLLATSPNVPFQLRSASDPGQLNGELRIVNNELDRLNNLASAQSFSTILLEELQTISISSFRSKVPVRALGATYAKGFCRGSRSIAGSMVFTIFDEHVLSKLLLAGSANNDIDLLANSSTALSDQLPPIDIQIEFANEMGDQSIEVIYGLEFINDGHTISIEDMLLENVFQWVARDMDPMRRFGDTKRLDFQGELASRGAGLTGRQLLKQPNIQGYLQRATSFDNNILVGS